MNFFTHLILGFILTTQFAFAKHDNGLKQAIDEFHYSMTVEWDQTDKEFAERKLAALKTSIQNLDLEKITMNDLREIFPTIREDFFKDEFALLGDMKSSELEAFLKMNESHLYQKGSAWNGEIVYPALFIGFVITVVAINIHREGKYADCVDRFKDHAFCENKY